MHFFFFISRIRWKFPWFILLWYTFYFYFFCRALFLHHLQLFRFRCLLYSRNISARAFEFTGNFLRKMLLGTRKRLLLIWDHIIEWKKKIIHILARVITFSRTICAESGSNGSFFCRKNFLVYWYVGVPRRLTLTSSLITRRVHIHHFERVTIDLKFILVFRNGGKGKAFSFIFIIVFNRARNGIAPARVYSYWIR